jgi:membrane-associated protein
MDFLKQLLGIVLHLQDHLFDLTTQYGAWFYAILFGIIFAETGLVVMPFLPGDSLVFAVGAVAANPKSGLNVWVAALVMVSAALLGDMVNYWVGRKLGQLLPKKFPRLVRQQYIDKTRGFFEKYGPKTIIIARFVPVVRTFTPFVAGMGAMPFPRFMAYSAAGALLWIGLILPCGWFLGGQEFVRRRFEIIVLAIIFISLLPMVFEFVKARRAAKQASGR